MPNIVEYNAPQGEAIRPSELPETAYQLVGRRAGNVGNETAQMIRQGGLEQEAAAKAQGHALERLGAGVQTLGNVVERHEAQNELLPGAIALATTADGLTQMYDKMVKEADPFDTTVSQRFREQVLQPALSNFADNFNTPAGKEWATTHAAQLATEFYRHTTATDMARAGDQAKQGVTQTANTLSNMAVRDPAMIDTALGMVPGTVAAIAKQANVSPELQSKITSDLGPAISKHIVMSGLQSKIDTDPEAGLAIANSGKYSQYISGQETVQLQQRAAVRQRLIQTQADHDEVTATKMESQTFKQGVADIYSTMIAKDSQGNPTGDLVVPPDFGNQAWALSQLPGAKSDPTAIKGLFDFANSVKEQNASGKMDTTDPHLVDQFNARVFSAANPLTVQDVDRAKAGHLLSNGDYTRYREAAKDQEQALKIDPNSEKMVTENFQAARDYINPKSAVNIMGDAQGRLAEARFMRYAVPTYLSLVRRGQTPQQALDQIMVPANLDKFKAPSAADQLFHTQGQTAQPGAPRPPLADILR